MEKIDLTDGPVITMMYFFFFLFLIGYCILRTCVDERIKEAMRKEKEKREDAEWEKENKKERKKIKKEEKLKKQQDKEYKDTSINYFTNANSYLEMKKALLAQKIYKNCVQDMDNIEEEKELKKQKNEEYEENTPNIYDFFAQKRDFEQDTHRQKKKKSKDNKKKSSLSPCLLSSSDESKD